MTQLSKQSIRARCTLPPPPYPDATVIDGWHPMISPFEPNKVRVQGVSKGLSHASYDASIAHDLVLGRHPGYVIKEWIGLQSFGIDAGWLSSLRWWEYPLHTRLIIRILVTLLLRLVDLQRRLRDEPPAYALAYTIEDFCMPADVSGAVCDKSTFARVFVSAYNTFFDPGFHGNATLELVNDSAERVEYKKGQGVCQFVFYHLDEPTEAPYDGKYQHQTREAHGPRYEAAMDPAVRPEHGGSVGHNLSWSGQKGAKPWDATGGNRVSFEEWIAAGGVPFDQGHYDSASHVDLERMRDNNQRLYGGWPETRLAMGENLTTGSFGVSHDKDGVYVSYPDGSTRLVKP